jgi:hypothetical protein
MRTKYIFIWAFLLTARHCVAQNLSCSIFAAATLPIGVEGSAFRGETTFDRFASNFNAANQGSLVKGLTSLTPTFSLHGGASCSYGVFYGEAAYQTFRAESVAEFKNGNKRVMEFSQNYLAMYLGLGYTSKYVSAYAVAGYLLGDWNRDKMKSYTLYPDGFKSYGNENALNGYYSGSSNDMPVLGLRLNAGIKRVKISLMADRFFLPFDPSNNLARGYSDDYDLNNEVEVYGSFGANVGTNWLKYLADPSQYILDDGELLTSELSLTQFRIGVSYTLFSLDSDSD